MQPTAKSFILDLLSTLKKGAMPVRALIAAAELFGIEENSVRVALARLLRAGLVERDERGHYRLGTEAEAVSRRVAAWRAVEGRVVAWEGGWIAVHTAGLGSSSRKIARRRQRALRLLGFRTLRPGLEIRPENLVGGVARVREDLRSLGLEPEVLVTGLRDLDVHSDAKARCLWDVDGLSDAYRSLRAELAASARRLPRLTDTAAMVESFLLGGRAIRALALDPLLPDPLVAVRERLALGEELERYDQLGRAPWSRFLKQFDLPNLEAPADVRAHDRAVGWR